LILAWQAIFTARTGFQTGPQRNDYLKIRTKNCRLQSGRPGNFHEFAVSNQSPKNPNRHGEIRRKGGLISRL